MTQQGKGILGSAGNPNLGITLFVDDTDVEKSFKRYNKQLAEAERQTQKFARTVGQVTSEAARAQGEYFSGAGQMFSASADDMDQWRQNVHDDVTDVQGYFGQFSQHTARVTADQVKMWRDNSGAVQQSTRRTRKSLKQQIRSLRNLRWELITMMFFYRQLMIIVKAAWEGVQKAQEASIRRAGLEALATMYDRSADAIVQSLERVSEGTLDTRVATQAVQQAMIADLGQFASSYDDLWLTAEAVMVTVGTEAPKAFEALVEGIVEGDAAALDSVATWLEAEQALSDYAYETNRLVDELSLQERQHVLLQHVQERTNQFMEDGGEAAIEQRRQVNQLGEAWSDLRDGVIQASQAGPEGRSFLSELTDLTENAALVATAAVIGFQSLKGAIVELEQAPLEILRRIFRGEGLEGLEVDPFQEFMDAFRESARAGLDALGYFKAEVEDTEDAIEDAGRTSIRLSEQDINLLEQRLQLYQSMAETVRQAHIDMQRAIQDLELERTREIENLVLDSARKREEIEIDLRRKLEDINRRYQRDVEDVEEETRNRRASIERRYRDRLITIEENYVERLLRVQEDYQMSLWEAIGERDATAALQAQRQRSLEIRRAGRSRDQQRRQAERDYKRQLADLQAALEQQRREAARARERARQDAEIARQRAREDAERAREQEEQDLEIALERQEEDIRLSLERRREDLWDHYNQQIYLMNEQHTQMVKREHAFQTNDLAMYKRYLDTKIQYYNNYISRMGFSATSPGNPYTGPYDTYGSGYAPPGTGSYYQGGGQFIARSPQHFIAGEGSRPELVSIQPLRQPVMTPQVISNVSGRIDHQVRGIVQGQMSGLTGQLTAAINTAVVGAMENVLK